MNLDLTTARLGERCRQLIDIPSVSGDEAAVQDHIARTLPAEARVLHEDDSVIYAELPRRAGAPLVILAGHTDTVPIDGNVPSTMSDDAIHGRGASDMKGGLAVMLELAHWAARTDVELRYDFGFLFFGREELPAAACPLLPALRSGAIPAADLAIVMEPTANALEVGCQGNLNLTLRFDGIAAHSARPWAGSNAAHAAVRALSGLAQLEPRRTSVGGLDFTEVANIVGMRSGTARNVLPASAEVDVNIRYAPSRTAADAEAEWCEHFAREGAHVEVIGNAAPAPVVTDHPIVRALQVAGAGDPTPKVAWTNTSDFAQCGTPAVNFGPGDPSLAHRSDEHITIRALERSFDILTTFARGARA